MTSNEDRKPRTSHLVALASHAIVRSPEGSLLVIRRHGTDYLDGMWSVPAGHIEFGERAAQACARELREEVAIQIDEAALTFVLVQEKSGADGEERVDFFFTADCNDPDQATVASPHELDAIRWVDPADLPEPFAPYVRTALGALAQGRTFSSWGL